MIGWTRPVALVNARVAGADGIADTIRFDRRVLALGDPPARGDSVIDLEGAIVLPGLINAHDHLELNHYGRFKCRPRYQNVAEWIRDLRPLLTEDPRLRAGQSYPLSMRLFAGLLKNLLSGVTTVAHHNPLYPELRGRTPIRVVQRYGWAHSFLLEREPAGARGEPGGEVARRFRRTPPDRPFIVHLAEGIDEQAHAELGRFDALGCLAANAVLVHGVAIDREGWQRVARAGAGLVWCPGSNRFLFDRTAAIAAAFEGGCAPDRVALGTDSRLTGENDLLDELRTAASLAPIGPDALLRMVTEAPASLLQLPDVGRLTRGAHADLIVIPNGNGRPPAEALLSTERRHLKLSVVGGRPVVASPQFAPVFEARRVRSRRIVVDGEPKLADSRVGAAIARSPVQEPQVTCA